MCCLQSCFRFPVSRHYTSRTGEFWLVLKCLDYFFPVCLEFFEGIFVWCGLVWRREGVCEILVFWDIFWSVSWLVCFGVFVEFWGFVCFILLKLFVCWCAFRRSVLLDLECKMF